MTIAVTRLANPKRIAAEVMRDIFAPPPPVDLLAWAKKNIVFSERGGPFPGPYNEDRFPFFSEILRALGPDDPCRVVTLLKSAQIGGTVLANVFVCGAIDLDPGDMMYVHPTEDNARRWSRLKLAEMIKTSAVLRKHFPERSRDGSDAILYKERADGRGSITVSGANSPASLSQVSMRRQCQDDLAKWEINTAGDPETQADNRSRAFDFAKIFKISTPLVDPGCRITKNFEQGTRERFHVPCPHCGYRHTLEWENLQASIDAGDDAEPHFTCPDCGSVIEEHHRAAMVRQGVWIADNPAAMSVHRSFSLWSAYSPLQSWALVAAEWRKAKGNAAAEQVFLNDTVGRAYKAAGEAPAWEGLRERAERLGHRLGTIPEGFAVITVGVDCQKDRVEWQAVAWSRDRRRAIVDHGVINGHVTEADTRQRLDELMAKTWPTPLGRRIGVDMLAIDGNFSTEEVFDWVRRHPLTKVIMVRGVPSENAALLQKVEKERDRQGKVKKYAQRFYNFATSVLKLALYRSLAKDDPLAPGFVALPQGLSEDFYRQLTAERRVARRDRQGFTRYIWEKDPTQANEMLDTHLQAEAAALRFGATGRDRYLMPEARWDDIEAERLAPVEAPQLDLETFVAAPAVKAAVPPVRPAPRPALPQGAW